MKLREMIDIFETGCSIAGPRSIHDLKDPCDCPHCTRVFIDALKSADDFDRHIDEESDKFVNFGVLLNKYMALVINEESISFLGRLNRGRNKNLPYHWGGTDGSITFTDEEHLVLSNMEKDIRDESNTN